MNQASDAQLLRAYAESGHEAAFRELVGRHTDFVYSAALRQVESSAVAGDLAQSVFTDLARKAPSLAAHVQGDRSLAGWLHRATRFAALNHRRDTQRRQTNERLAMEQLLTNAEPAVHWEHIRPALDEALDHLDDEDREALLLRYFQNQDYRAVGLALGVSDDTAQKRVTRALERLREYFSQRKITIGASGLAVLISANAVQAAPIGLAATITAAALAGTAVSTATVIATATKTIVMTTLQKTLITATLAIVAGAGLYEAKQAAAARAEVQTLQQQQAPLAEQIRQLQAELGKATNRLAGLIAENSRLKSNPERTELLKLRGEVTRLRPLQADVKALQKMVNQSSSGLPEWTTNNVANVGRTTPMDALESYIFQSLNGNMNEIKNSIVGDDIDPPPQDALQNFADDKTNHPLANDGVGGFKIISQTWMAADKVQLELNAKFGNGGAGVSVPFTMRNVNGDWKLIVFNVRDADGKANRLSFVNESPVH